MANPSNLPEGRSGYFSTPSHGLDPHIFDAEHMKPEVRDWLWRTLTDELAGPLDLSGTDNWLYAWVAGSGVTYQWDADRGLTGDLDVLFGVDYQQFINANAAFRPLTDANIAEWLNSALKERLWPKTSHADINGQTYEVTFYDNPGTGKDIRNINPYAAYDLRLDKWAVRPPTMEYLVSRTFPQEWVYKGNEDQTNAQTLLDAYAGAQWDRNKRSVGQAAKALFDEIHLGRREAFAPGGKGYGDFHNYRWQAAKRSGVVAGLSSILDTEKQHEESADEELYGGPIASSDVLMNRMLFNRKPGT